MLDEQLQAFTSGAAVVLGGRASCSILMRLDGDVRRSASSDPLAAACDEVELVVDEGPCLDALETGMVTLVDDLATEDRWPAWTRRWACSPPSSSASSSHSAEAGRR